MEYSIKKIAELACLDIDPVHYEEFAADFDEIVEMMSELPEYGCNDHVPEPMELRDDAAGNTGCAEELSKNAPEFVNGCFTVPRTVEY